jgi:hypothetical protein
MKRRIKGGKGGRVILFNFCFF